MCVCDAKNECELTVLSPRGKMIHFNPLLRFSIFRMQNKASRERWMPKHSATDEKIGTFQSAESSSKYIVIVFQGGIFYGTGG